MTTLSTHPNPNEILYGGARTPPGAAVCDHYAGTPSLVQKSMALMREIGPLFDITCDLEDGAAPGERKGLCESFCDLIESGENLYRQVGMRFPDVTTIDWRDLVTYAVTRVGSLLSHITLPKVENAKDVHTFMQHLVGETARLQLATPPVHVLIESPRAVASVWEIAATPGLRGLDFGAMDFVSSFSGTLSSSAMSSPGQFENPLVVHAKTQTAMAAAAYNLIPVHNVTPQFRDANRTFDDARRARVDFGFQRMWSVHPIQVRAIIDAMRPTPEEVSEAETVISAAIAATWGPTRVGDVMHDKASYRHHWHVLRRASKTGTTLRQDLVGLVKAP